MTMFDDSEAYTVAEIAEKMKVTKHTIYRLIKTGKLGSVRLMNAVRVCGWQINEYLRSSGSKTA